MAQQREVESLVRRMQEHCPRLGSHSLLTAHIASVFGEHLGLSHRDQTELIRGALLHDVGKLRLPASLLSKTSPLSPEDWQSLKQHPELGIALIENTPANQMVRDAILHHHERADGSGYPMGLYGEDIPMVARMVAICDVYAALIEERSYRTAPVDALGELSDMQDKLDPKLLKAFLSVHQSRKMPSTRVKTSERTNAAA